MERKNAVVPGVFLVVRKDDQILLLQRKDTGYWDGCYSMVSGHVELGENFTDAIIREAKEEAGISITREQVKVIHVQNKMADDATHQRVHVYFLASGRTGEIQNMEPDKCSDLSWFAINQLPENISPCVRFAIEHIQKGAFYSEFWW